MEDGSKLGLLQHRRKHGGVGGCGLAIPHGGKDFVDGDLFHLDGGQGGSVQLVGGGPHVLHPILNRGERRGDVKLARQETPSMLIGAATCIQSDAV